MNRIGYFVFLVRSSVDDFKRNKLRTLLTSLGILIGVSSVILLISLGLGLRKYIQDMFQSLGANLIIVVPGKMLQGGMTGGSAFLTGGKFDEKDVISLRKVKNLSLVVPVYIRYSRVIGLEEADTYEIIASTPDVFPILNFKIKTGRLFDKSDVESGNKVIVLGSKVAEKLFKSQENALGKTAKIEEQGYKIIGVLEAKGGGGFGPSLDDHVFIPYKAAYSFNPNKKFWGIYAKAFDESILAETKEEIRQILLKRYNDDDFSVNDQQEFLNTFNMIFEMINMILVAIAAISLVVGGVGVMNIMYVSVVERVKEIGIRRAYGARKKDILFLFLIESVLLSLIGGFLGLLLVYLIVWLIQRFFPAYIDGVSVMIALGVSTVIGIVFGVFPARRAANFTPIEAIKFE